MRSLIQIEEVSYEFDLPPVSSHYQTVQVGTYSLEIMTQPSVVAIRMGEGILYSKHEDLGAYKCCTNCRKIYRDFYNGPEGSLMKEKHICFNCSFWEVIIRKYEHYQYWFRIEGSSYCCRPESVCDNRVPRNPSNDRGFSGRTFHIRLLDSGRELTVDDLWHQGTIPNWVKERFQDNAEFIIL